MVRLPLVRELLRATASQLGLLLFCGAVGSMIALSFIGKIIGKVGTRPTILVGSFVLFTSLVGEVIAISAHSKPFFGFFMFFFGVGVGTTDVGLNVDGSAIEQFYHRSILPRMHSAYSFGTLIGAGIGTLATLFKFSLLIQVLVLAGLSFLVPIYSLKVLPHGNGIVTKAEPGKLKHEKHWLSWGLVFLAIGIFGMTLAEGASNDWLTLGLVDDYKTSKTIAGCAYAILLFSIFLTRYFGGKLVDRIGRGHTLQLLAVVGMLGLVILILSNSLVLAFIGAVLWGSGVSLGFPLFISAAGGQEHSARKVAFVTTSGYGAFLVGPPLLGFLGQSWGFLNMYWVIVGFLVLAFVAASQAGKRTSTHSA